jgi:hypothetical protein
LIQIAINRQNTAKKMAIRIRDISVSPQDSLVTDSAWRGALKRAAHSECYVDVCGGLAGAGKLMAFVAVADYLPF